MLMKSLLEIILSKPNWKLSLRELLLGPVGLDEQPLLKIQHQNTDTPW